MVTIFYDSHDKEEEEVAYEQGEETDCEEPEYGNTNLKYMKHHVRTVCRCVGLTFDLCSWM
jgi:hypothetical protein